MEQQKTRRVVVKVGTSTLTHATGQINLQRLEALARALTDIKNSGCEVVLVSSGAIAAGVTQLGLPERPRELPKKQAAAAVGQCRLMHIYDKLFSEYGQKVGQILLTREDMDIPRNSENLKNTFDALLSWGVIPVVNENDSVSGEEIESGQTRQFGDNDTLSALVARLTNAELLVLLTDIDGLYDADPRTHPEAKRIARVTALTPELLAAAGGAGSTRGTGGMATKLSAARICLDAGIQMVIADGENPALLYKIMDGEPVGTLFSS